MTAKDDAAEILGRQVAYALDVQDMKYIGDKVVFQLGSDLLKPGEYVITASHPRRSKK